MKKIFSFIIPLALLIGCSKSASTDKKAELANLVKQEAEISAKIKTLQAEIAGADTVQKEDKSKLVAVTEMKPQPFNHYIELQAKVEGDEDVTIGPESMGTVKEVLVEAGDKVTKGQVLATLDDKAMRESMAEVQSQLDLATTVYNRQKNLWEQKIGSEIQYLQAKTNKESLEKRSSAIREQWNMTRIKSPINGVVDDVTIKVGQTAAPGMASFRIVNLSSLKVKGEVAESYISKIHQNDNVIIYFPDQGKELRSKLSYSGLAINKLNRTFNVEVSLKQSEGTFYPNQVVVLKIIDYTSPKAFTVPVGSIQKSAEGEFVYVAANEQGRFIVKRKNVITGMTYGGMTEIKSGLEEGDKVITNGYQNVIDGDAVQL